MRSSVGFRLDEAICAYDLAERLGIEVRFADIPSMEGMYYRASDPAIILSSLRPSGRRAFTCAHELGHHSNGDGTSVDQLVEKSNRAGLDPKEFAADCFAGILLMPRMAVQRAFVVRNCEIQECTPGQVWTVSNYFGVGYSTLIHHMRSALRLLPDAHAAALLKVNPQKAQDQALGWESQDTVWIVDPHWTGRAVDVEVDDLIFVQGRPASEGICLSHVQDMENGRLFRARQPGIGKFCNRDGWDVFARVSSNAHSWGAAYFAIWKKRMKKRPVIIEQRNLSVAWGMAFLDVLKDSEVSPLVVVIKDLNGGEPPEVPSIREALDQALESGGKGSCHTVANTIFPSSMWNPQVERKILFDRYLLTLPRLRKRKGNRNGLYFERLIAFGHTGDYKDSFNQLDHVIKTWDAGNSRRSALQAALFDPHRDHTDQRQRGFPCLMQVAFDPQGKDGLAMTGIYVTQYIFERAYGNYLGLIRLGNFMAHEMGLTLERVTCVATRTVRDSSKTSLQPLAKCVQNNLLHFEAEDARE